MSNISNSLKKEIYSYEPEATHLNYYKTGNNDSSGTESSSNNSSLESFYDSSEEFKAEEFKAEELPIPVSYPFFPPQTCSTPIFRTQEPIPFKIPNLNIVSLMEKCFPDVGFSGLTGFSGLNGFNNFLSLPTIKLEEHHRQTLPSEGFRRTFINSDIPIRKQIKKETSKLPCINKNESVIKTSRRRKGRKLSRRKLICEHCSEFFLAHPTKRNRKKYETFVVNHVCSGNPKRKQFIVGRVHKTCSSANVPGHACIRFADD